jgi:hypothetical protein
MSAGVLRLLDDPPAAGRLAEAGHARVIEQFNWPTLARAAERAYAAALRQRRYRWVSVSVT